MTSQSFLPFLAHDSFSPLGPIYQESLKDILNSNIVVYDDPDIIDYINSLDNNILNFLNEDKKAIQLVKSHQPSVIKFICNNIENLFAISFDLKEENKRKSNTALSILLSADPQIHEKLINNDTQILAKMTNFSSKNDDD